MIFNPIFHMILPVYNIQPGSRGFRIFRYIIRCHAIKRNAHIMLATWGDATTYIQINCYENDKTLVLFSHRFVPNFPLVDHISFE